MINTQLFKGQAVYLGPAKKEDNETIWRWFQDQEYFQQAYGGSPYAITLESIEKEEAKFNEDSATSEFRIRENGTDRLVGLIWLSGIDRSFGRADLSVSIGGPEDRGKGYGSEAIRLVLGYAFRELRLHRIGLSVYRYNEAAHRLYLRLGFVDEGAARDGIFRNGRFWDVLHMGILEDEFNQA